jgi:hypothetical protein
MPFFGQIYRQENRILCHTPWFPADMRTHTYHIALVQIYLFIFFFSGYYTVPKINYINAMKSINQICTHFSRKQRKKTHAYRLFFGAFLERLGRPPLLVTSPIGKCSAGRPFFSFWWG